MENFERYLEFCETKKQRLVIEALIRNGGHRNLSAKESGIDIRGFYRMLNRIKKAAADRGFSQEHDLNHVAPPGFHVKGTSTLYDSQSGEPKIQWVKTQNQGSNFEDVKESILEVFEEYKGCSKPLSAPKYSDGDTLTVYPIGDYHVGLKAIENVSPTEWSLQQSKAYLIEAIKRLISCGRPSETCVILNLGDFFHIDSTFNKTTKGKNTLDVDGRWEQIVKTGVEIMISVIEAASQRHKKVIVKNLQGNHDQHSSVLFSIALDLFYSNNKRVDICTDTNKFWYHTFGRVLLGSVHGDSTKTSSLPGIMAVDMAQAWGHSDFRYWLTGHIHHSSKTEGGGCVIESFRSLIPGDSWHHSSGYRSGRDQQSIIYHKEFGEIERHRIDARMIRG